jgi:hypothetical protein
MDKDLGYKILAEITETKVDIAEIKRDIAHHIERTNLNEERIGLLEDAHLNCPALQDVKTKSTLLTYAKDWTVVCALVLVILKLFNLIPFSF